MDNFNINLNLYRNFYYVAKYESFTKASEHVKISQSALSISVQKLENELDTPLFIRLNNEIKLTNKGQELYLKLKDIIYILTGEMEKEEINIGCLRFIADNYLEEVIYKFKSIYPNINLKLDFSADTELFQKLKKGELDIIICRYPLFYKFDKQIIVEKIVEVKNVLACSQEFYLKNKDSFQDETYTYPLILPNKSEKRRIIDDYLISKNVKHNIVMELPNSLLLKKLILKGIGIGYINQKFVASEIENREIIILNKFENLPTDNITIIYNSKNINKTIKKFIEILKSLLII